MQSLNMLKLTMPLLLYIHCSLLIPFIKGDLSFCPCFVIQYLVTFTSVAIISLGRKRGREGDVCFNLFVFLTSR